MNQFSIFFFSEIKSRFKQPQMYFYMLIIGVAAFSVIKFAEYVNMGVYLGNIERTSHLTLLLLMAGMGGIALYLFPVFISAAATKDFDAQFHEIMFAIPIKKWAYFWGKFMAAWASTLIVYLALIPGYLIGVYFLEPHQKGTEIIWSGLFDGFLLFILPNSFILTAMVFAVAIYFRNIIAAYVLVIILATCYSVAFAFLGADVDSRPLASYFNSDGMAAFSVDVQYWTVSDKNTKIYSPSLLMWANRMVWIGIALVVILTCYFRFSFSHSLQGLFNIYRKKLKISAQNAIVQGKPMYTIHNTGFCFKALFSRIIIEYTSVVKHISFIIITLMGLVILGFNLYYAGKKAYGISTLPVSYWMSEIAMTLNILFGQIIIIFFSGQMMWADREQKTEAVTDTLPVSAWVLALGKIFALCFVVITLQVFSIVACIGYQLSQSYFDIDIMPYLKVNMLLEATKLCFWVVLSICVQSICQNKALGYIISIALFISQVLAVEVGLNHMLWQPWIPANVIYSDMNSLFPYTREIIWSKLYSFLFAIMLIYISVAFWQRGNEGSIKFRIRQLLSFVNNKNVYISGMLVLLLLGCTVGKIYYDTIIINHHETEKDKWKTDKVDFEKKYKKYERRPQPRITNSVYQIELYPQLEKIEINGKYTLVNASNTAIDTLHIFYHDKINMKIDLPQSTVNMHDTIRHYVQIKLITPLQKGDSTILSFACNYQKIAMENWVSHTNLTGNGTFINKADFAPTIGYQGTMELYGKWERKKYGLKDKDLLASSNDTVAAMQTYISLDADYGHIQATIGTDIDQIAVAPGNLVRKQIKNNRAYYTYKSTEPILNFYSFCSARYTITKEMYNGISLEVYHYPKHTKNVNRMIKGMKDAIVFCERYYSPYTYKHARIIEYPRYQQFAQSFPNTIPYSESSGFIFDFDKEIDLDIVYYTTAHEIAHQWWGHQVSAANVEGCTFMIETMAQYTALQVMEKEYGAEKMKKFLKFEMDTYLGFRGREQEKELPIIINQHQQYIHYQKGSVVMYALGKYVGFDKINTVLQRFIKNNYHRSAPYPTSAELYSEIKSIVPDSLKYLAEDMFEKIVLYDNRITDAIYEKTNDNKYKVYFTATCKKYNADSVGYEKVVPVSDYLDLAIFGKDDKMLIKKRIKLTQQSNDYIWVTDEKPEKAAIDPDYLLIDRNPSDNVKNIKESNTLTINL
ncbi:MAG: M1 family aminopeptidase [Cytophagales bacterium]|nr:M1 family aminopeptidase [Cytophagales bacterium]